MAKQTQTVDSYIAARSAPVQSMLIALRKLIQTTLPEAKEGMKWGAPVYFDRNQLPICYLYGGKDHANLGFVRGSELDAPEGLLKGQGEKGRHVEIYPDKAFPKAELTVLLKQCIELG
ncbi:DUF1801 domain-containing protein [Hoeflea sp. TYP-13]|uniref:DUF1801 domain-containing protein n=1 Tax=Hoeflea sp. TYP-13 TaxID=3230023 RepID=UPI0034C62D25